MLKQTPMKQWMLSVIVGLSPLMAFADEPTADELVKQCVYKYPGDDNRSILTVMLTDSSGQQRTEEYLRLWKDAKGVDNIADKMVLFTRLPLDAAGTGFMRWAFTRNADRNADQWIYLPSLRKIRRVSVRDPGDSFLGSDLTYADITGRALEEDTHKLLKSETIEGQDYYVVEHLPKEKNPLYTKRISWYAKKSDLSECVTWRIDYYDRRNDLLKRQTLTWQHVGKAWLWDTVNVQNLQTNHASKFSITKPEINVGLKDDIFTERNLQQGHRK